MSVSHQANTRRGVLILSPHPDDAAFSIGGLMHILSPPVRLVTVFGRTDFLGRFGFQQHWRYATLRRKAEDEEFAKLIGVELTYCDLPEASLRIGRSYNSLFASRQGPVVDVPSEVVRTLIQITRNMNPTDIFAPLGLGWHRDHLIIRDVAAFLAGELPARLTYYEDLPYAANLLSGDIQTYISSLGKKLIPITLALGHYTAKKLYSIEVYRSQISNDIVELIHRYSLELNPSCGAERLWSLEGDEPAVLGTIQRCFKPV